MEDGTGLGALAILLNPLLVGGSTWTGAETDVNNGPKSPWANLLLNSPATTDSTNPKYFASSAFAEAESI